MTPDEYAQCRRLGFKTDGCIREDLKTLLQERVPRSFVVMAKDKDKVLSWALVDKTTENEPMVQIYTRHGYRRMGLGSKVMQRVKYEIGPKYHCFRSTEGSSEFFDSVGAERPNKATPVYLHHQNLQGRL